MVVYCDDEEIEDDNDDVDADDDGNEDDKEDQEALESVLMLRLLEKEERNEFDRVEMVLMLPSEVVEGANIFVPIEESKQFSVVTSALHDAKNGSIPRWNLVKNKAA